MLAMFLRENGERVRTEGPRYSCEHGHYASEHTTEDVCAGKKVT